jgi:excisionase family DNA binding protein
MQPARSHTVIAAVPAKPSEDGSLTVGLTLTSDQLDAIAERVAERLQPAQPEHSTPWLDTKGAAAYLACTPARIHDLVALQKLTPRRDGRRLLFYRSDLDAYLKGP